jgi:hypothetical protein
MEIMAKTNILIYNRALRFILKVHIKLDTSKKQEERSGELLGSYSCNIGTFAMF